MTRLSPSRTELLHIIHERPGLTKSELSKASGLSWGTVTYHLDVLKESGSIHPLKDSGRLRIFPPGIPPEEIRWISALRLELGKKIAQELAQTGSAQAYELAEALDASSKVIRRHLHAMHEAGTLKKTGSIRPRYELRSAVRRFMDRMGQ